ncbi:MAG: 2-dehydropantoate 2-reductase [bacterium]
MRILFVGAGGVGGYFGGCVAARGGDVAFLARGVHADAIRAEGLRVRTGGTEIVVRPQVVARGDATISADALVVAVKHRDLEDALATAQPHLKPGGVVLSLLNGIGHEPVLRRLVPQGHVLLGMAFVGASIEAPGVIRHTTEGRMAFGEPDGPPSAAAQTLCDALAVGGFPVRVVDQVQAALWRKVMWNAAFNSINTLVGGTCGDLMRVDGMRVELRAVMEEVRAVARAEGVDLPLDWLEKSLEAEVNFSPYVTSMRLDRERGRVLELEPILRRPLAIARRHRVPVPRLELLERLLSAAEATSERRERG